MTGKQKFLHAESLQTLGLYDDTRTLLGNLGLLHFVDRKCVTYDRLILEFLSSLRMLRRDMREMRRGKMPTVRQSPK